jgi:hypothetical protein
MSRFLVSAILALACAFSVGTATAQMSTRDQVRAIEQEYARQTNGRMIPDNQLEYYLDRANSGWSMNQISADMANSQRAYANRAWQPQTGWTAREVVCSSINSRYTECATPFRSQAVITQQISNAACVEGQSWGQKPGAVWVNRGCRARFGILPTGNRNGPGERRMVVCQSNRGRLRTCDTGFRGRVELVNRLNNSAACIEGRTWGQREGQVWVTGGCRAQFASVGRRGRGDWNDNRNDDRYGDRNDNRDGNWNENLDRNYAITCASTNNAQVRCNWDERYGEPRLDQQISQSACIQGRTWGYDRSGDIWVTGGCRARFVSSSYGR